MNIMGNTKECEKQTPAAGSMAAFRQLMGDTQLKSQANTSTILKYYQPP